MCEGGVPSYCCGDVRTLTGACGIVRSGVPRCLARDKLNRPKSVYKGVPVCVYVCVCVSASAQSSRFPLICHVIAPKNIILHVIVVKSGFICMPKVPMLHF